jgi:hypothetical protein
MVSGLATIAAIAAVRAFVPVWLRHSVSWKLVGAMRALESEYPVLVWRRFDQAARRSRLAIFAIVARLQPVALCTALHDCPAAIIRAIPLLRSISSRRPL